MADRMKEPRFDYHKLRSKQVRALRRNQDESAFLHELAAEIIAERLAVVERTFSDPVLLFDGIFSKQILSVFEDSPCPIDGIIQKIERSENEILRLEPETIDLAISIFDLQRINDLPMVFFQIVQALKPDGLFLAIMPCEGTLKELRDSVLNAEVTLTGGAGLRVDAFPHLRDLGDLLQKSGFKLPVVDLEERLIRYGAFENLIADLRNAGAGNIASGMIRPLGKHCLDAVKNEYLEKHSDQDGKLRASINLACLSGWKEHASQQKPLRPGSAKQQLRDFI